MSQTFCYHCVKYTKLDTICAKFHDHWTNNNKVIIEASCSQLMTEGSKKPMSNRVKSHKSLVSLFI